MFAHGWDVEREQRHGAAEGDGDRAAGHQDAAAQRRREGLGRAQRRRAAPVHAAAVGVRRHARSCRPASGAADRVPGNRRRSRQHADPRAVGQWREPGGRPARLRQRDGARTISAPSRSRKSCGGSTTSAARTRTPISRMAGRWRPTRRCAATSRTPMAAASAIPSSCPGRSGCRRRANCAISSSTPAIWCRPCSNWSASSAPAQIAGVAQMPIEGESFARSHHRRRGAVKSLAAIFRDVRASRHLAPAAGRRSPFIRRARRSRTTNGSCSISTAISRKSTISPPQEPERLAELIEMWWSEAEKHKVLPLDDRFGPRFAENAARFQGARNHFVFHAGMGHVPTDVAPDVRSRSYTIEAHVEIGDAGAEGVLIAHGDATSGYSLYVKDGHLVHDLNIGGGHEIVTSDRKVPPGAHRLGVHVERLVRDTPPAKGARTGVHRLYAADRRRARGLAADPARRSTLSSRGPASTSAATAPARCRITRRRSNSPGGCCGSRSPCMTTRSSTATASAPPKWQGNERPRPECCVGHLILS